MDRREFLKILAQSSAGIGATAFIDKAWGFPVMGLSKSESKKLFMWGQGQTVLNQSASILSAPILSRSRFRWDSFLMGGFAAKPTAFGKNTAGDLYCWGTNENGQLGLGHTNSTNTPTLFGNSSDWQSLAIGSDHCVAVRSDGVLWTWGNNTQGQQGLGPDYTQKISPTSASGMTGCLRAYAGNNSSFVIKNDNTLWASGPNTTSGMLGLGLITGNTVNFQNIVSPGVSGWSSLSVAADHCLGIKIDGTLWAWGLNTNGQLGNGLLQNASTPIQIGSATNWSKVFTDYSVSLAIDNSGRLWSWGYNLDGHLGLGHTSHVSTPVQVGSDSNWLTVAPGYSHVLALKTDNTLWGWGRSNYGQLGNGVNSSPQTTPVQIGTKLFTSISAFQYYSAAIRK